MKTVKIYTDGFRVPYPFKNQTGEMKLSYVPEEWLRNDLSDVIKSNEVQDTVVPQPNEVSLLSRLALVLMGVVFLVPTAFLILDDNQKKNSIQHSDNLKPGNHELKNLEEELTQKTLKEINSLTNNDNGFNRITVLVRINNGELRESDALGNLVRKLNEENNLARKFIVSLEIAEPRELDREENRPSELNRKFTRISDNVAVIGFK